VLRCLGKVAIGQSMVGRRLGAFRNEIADVICTVAESSFCRHQQERFIPVTRCVVIDRNL